MNPNLVSDIKNAEGCVLIAYKDTNGYRTIGYGHKLQEGINWEGHEISLATAEELLKQDLDDAQTDAKALPEWSCMVTLARENALIELVFNMGSHTWQGFVKCRDAMIAKNWEQAGNELVDSLWAKQVGKARSERLEKYIKSGTY